MKQRIYACVIILAVILVVTLYSDSSMDHLTESVDFLLAQAEAALDEEDASAAMQAVAQAAQQCHETRDKMTHFWRIEDLTELEATLQAALGYLKRGTLEEAQGEVRRASVQVQSLARLASRLI